jgi:excisionase family DNA binding protein
MPTLSHPPVKATVVSRTNSTLNSSIKANQQKQALVVDPLMRLSEAVPLLGNPSYQLLRKWIKDGSLRVWRAGHGHYRVRLSEIERFRSANEASHG